MLSSSEKKKTFKLETGGGTGHYQAIVVLELEGCRIFSIEEIRQDLIDLLTVTITIQPAQCSHIAVRGVWYLSLVILVNI